MTDEVLNPAAADNGEREDARGEEQAPPEVTLQIESGAANGLGDTGPGFGAAEHEQPAAEAPSPNPEPASVVSTATAPLPQGGGTAPRGEDLNFGGDDYTRSFPSLNEGDVVK